MVEIIRILRHSRRQHWVDALYWFFLSSIGGLLPLWGLFLILPLFNQSITFQVFTQNGEFALYAASLASASLYVITKEFGIKLLRGGTGKEDDDNEDGNVGSSKKGFPAEPLFVTVFVFVLVFTSLLFASVTLFHLPDSNLSINLHLLSITSVVGFGIALLLSYLTTVIDNYLLSFQAEKEIRLSRKQDLADVNEKFESLGKE
jgi:hypothetical protein